MNKIVKSIISVQIVLFSYMLTAEQVFAEKTVNEIANFYISPVGIDSNPGTLVNPFLTIERARDAVREKIAKGMNRDVVVILRGGNYFIDGAIRFDERDSGRDGRTVVYKAASGEKVSIYGGQRINGWKKVSSNIYRAKVEQGKRFYRLFENDSSLVMARHPNKGSGYGAGLKRVNNTTLTFPESWAVYDFSDAQVFGFLGGNWFSEMRAVIGVNKKSRRLTIDPGAVFRWGKLNDRVYIQGVKELLDEQGEWYLNHDEGYVYCWPYKTPIEKQIITAPASQRLLDISGTDIDHIVSNVRFEGICFIGSDFCERWRVFTDAEKDGTLPLHLQEGLVYIENAKNIAIKNCKIIGAGHSGILFNKYAQDCSVYGCWIEDAGFAGVYMNGWAPGRGPFSSAAESYVNKNHTISNNFIYNCGAFVGHGCGIQFFQSGDNTITHNLVSRMPRYGISYKGWCYTWTKLKDMTLFNKKINFENQFEVLHSRNNTIAYNEISNVCRDSFDYGAIESWGVGRDNLWQGNVIHDLDPTIDWDGWAHPLFPDDAGHYLTVRDNIVYECQGGKKTGVVMVKDIKLVIENNIFADNIMGRLATVEPYKEAAFEMAIRRNIISGDYGKLWSTCGKTFKIFFHDPKVKQGTPVVEEIDYNLFCQPYPEIGKYKHHKWDINSLQADAGFMRKNQPWDTHYTDFKLKPDSPAFKLGFKAIAIDQVGLRDDFPFDRSLLFRKQATDKIQAEDYDRMRGLRAKGGMGIEHIQQGAWVKYLNVDFGKGNINEFVSSLTYRQPSKANLQSSPLIKDYLTIWQISEVFRKAKKDGTALFNVSFSPETDQAETVNWHWQDGPSTNRAGKVAAAGVVDLGDILGETGDNCVGYLLTHIHSPQQQDSLLKIGSSDGLKVWLNGAEVHARNVSRPLKMGEDRILVKLQPGWNKLLLKVTQISGQWATAARFMTTDGKKNLPGLRIRTQQSEFKAGKANTAACSIRLDSPKGQIIGQLTQGQTVAKVKSVKGIHTVYLVFENNQVSSMDWFQFRGQMHK